MLSVILLAWMGGCGGSTSIAPPADDPASAVPVAPPEAEPTEARYAASHVLVSYAGAVRAPAGLERTEAEAHQRVVDVWRRLKAGESLEELATRYSDGPSAPRSGSVGVYRPGTMMPVFERAVAAVAVGEVTEPFQSAFGWHVARRDAVVEAHARHILVSWKGAVRSTSLRTKDEARGVIAEVQQRLEAGEDFAAVAKAMGEDATALHGGDLGVVAPGQLIPPFENALFALNAGQRSDIVETPYGFHVVERLR